MSKSEVKVMPLLETDLGGLRRYTKGKVRDIYDLGDKLLMVATDRISAFDVILPTGIPNKGKILTQMSLFWFDFTKDIVPNHLITANVDEYPEEIRKYREILEGRSMLVKKAKRIDIECVVRGYISGSLWKEYKEKKQSSEAGESIVLHGISLPTYFQESVKLLEPIFTPATKAEKEHDENISFEQMSKMVGDKLASFLKEKSLKVYRKASSYAMEKGIIIADTKLEFGLLDDKVILIDEIISPDSSRFWPKEKYIPGRSQESFDKQYVRDFLERIQWDKKPPAPELSPEVVLKTMEKYEEAYRRLVQT
jgi:phosphoribosylaminoimidazole-succinocarboxamide synthase